MTIVPIHNEDWGFETNCFVCEPKNPAGLRIPFFHDTDQELVFATYALTNDFSGAPSVVHGGVTLAILDEAMAWACIAVAKQWAVTTKTSTEFIGAMYVGKQYRVEARIDDRLDGRLRTTGVVVDGKGRARAQATASFTALGAAQARRVIGDDLGGHAADYLRP